VVLESANAKKPNITDLFKVLGPFIAYLNLLASTVRAYISTGIQYPLFKHKAPVSLQKGTVKEGNPCVGRI